MKTQLATLLLVFAYHGAAAHNIRGTESDRHLRSSKGGNQKIGNQAYRVVGGKKNFNDNKCSAVLWLVVDSKDQNKVGKCATAISIWALENYAMNLAVVDKEPNDNRLCEDDIVVVLEKNIKTEECEDLVNEVANSPGFSARKRGGVFDDGQQNVAVFDIDPEDKKCEKDCIKQDDCDNAADPKGCEDSCKKECEKECKDDCDKYWKGLFNEQCRKAC